MDTKLPMEGGCRCGKTRFRVTRPALLTSACHCTGCQRMTSSAFSLSIAVPSDGFAITLGEPVIGGLHNPALKHHHCEHCKSWIFTRIEADKSFVNIRASMLDDHTGFVPFVELWTSEKIPWATTPAQRSFETMPAMEAFPSLLAEFAAHAQQNRVL